MKLNITVYYQAYPNKIKRRPKAIRTISAAAAPAGRGDVAGAQPARALSRSIGGQRRDVVSQILDFPYDSRRGVCATTSPRRLGQGKIVTIQLSEMGVADMSQIRLRSIFLGRGGEKLLGEGR